MVGHFDNNFSEKVGMKYPGGRDEQEQMNNFNAQRQRQRFGGVANLESTTKNQWTERNPRAPDSEMSLEGAIRFLKAL